MWNNLFVTYELSNPEEDLERVGKAIASLGNSTKLHSTCWYVNSPMSASDAAERVGKVMRKEDILIIADTSNDSGTWHNLEDKQAVRIRQNWKL